MQGGGLGEDDGLGGSAAASSGGGGGGEAADDADVGKKVGYLNRQMYAPYFPCNKTSLSFIFQAVVVGVCAMEKKSLSKPMREILTRLGEFEYIRTTIFPEEVILNVRH